MARLKLLALACLSLLNVAASGAAPLYGVATAALASQSPQALVIVDTASGNFSSIFPLGREVGAIVPTCFAVLPSVEATAVCTLRGVRQCIQLLSWASGALLNEYCSTSLVIPNLAYDTLTARLFFNGYVEAQSTNYVYELHYTGVNLTATQLVKVPGTVQVCISAYSAANSTLFLTVETDSGANNLVAVDMSPPARVVYTVPVSAAIEVLMVDDARGALYAWVATSVYAGQLALLDGPSGALAPIVSLKQYSANGGMAVVGPSDGVVYSSLLGGSNADRPVWAIVDPAQRPAAPVFAPIREPTYPFLIGLSF